MKNILFSIISLLLSSIIFAQTNSINPNSAFVGETVTVTITVANSAALTDSAPSQASDIYLEQDGDTIFTDAFSSSQVYYNGSGTYDSLQTDFTIPLSAVLGYYNVHTISYTTPGGAPVDNVIMFGFLVRAIGSCPVPSSVNTGGVTNVSATVSWASMTADTFRIRYFPAGTSNYSYKDVDGASSPVSAVITNLLPGTVYHLQVSTICGGVRSAYSIPEEIFTTTSSAASCIIPFDVDSSAVTNTSALISWSNLVASDTFRIRYALNGTTNYLYKDVNGSSHSSTITGLAPSSAYSVRVSSRCNGVSTGYSNPIIINTTSVAANCVIPTGVTASNIIRTAAKISWSNLVDADTFRIRYNETSTSNYFYVNINGSSGHSVTINGLLAATSYDVRVASVCNGTGSGYSAVETFSTTGTALACSVPTGVSIGSITNTGAVVSWSNSVTSDTFRVKYAISGSGNFLFKNINGSSHSTTLASLAPGTTYDVMVSSVCNGSGTGYSVVQNFSTTSAPTSCGVPFGLSSGNFTTTSADVSWSTSITSDSFLVRYSVSGSTNYSWKQIAGTAHSTTLTGLQSNTTYQWQVRSVCNGMGLTPYSTSSTFGTQLRLAQADEEPMNVNLYPNPASDILNIELNHIGNSESVLQIVDVSGKMMLKKKYSLSGERSFFSIDISSLASGIYFLSVNDGVADYRKKIIVE